MLHFRLRTLTNVMMDDPSLEEIMTFSVFVFFFFFFDFVGVLLLNCQAVH